ncbi:MULTISPECIES: hypothetical protein [Photorhabdus]|nr:hypothetical protein [Photorhabdus asymbiotica]
MTGVSECSQQRGNLKDNGYKYIRCTSAYKCNINLVNGFRLVIT